MSIDMDRINTLVDKVLKSRKNANKISDIIEYIHKHNSCLAAASSGALKIFTKIFSNEDISFTSASSELSTVEQYKQWIGERYSECLTAILSSLTGVNAETQTALFDCSMELIKLKCRFLFKSSPNEKDFLFCESEMAETMKTVIFSDDSSILEMLCSYSKYDDLRYFILKLLPSVICLIEGQEVLLRKCFTLLKSQSSSMPSDKVELNRSFVFDEEQFPLIKQRRNSPFSIQEQRKVFGKAWLEFMKLPLSISHQKQVLIIIQTSIIPHFSKPRLLADFLITSFQCGGGIALLALHGLFVLMNEHNLEYPDFYQNLYSMLHPRIFDKKFKSRFFHLLQIFLSSTHIPSYLVAAFVKKLSHLSLSAPPHCSLIIINLISTLIRQHPSISYLINQRDQENKVVKDPFLSTEPDPAKCRAVDSSLWEIDCLQHHYLPEVAKAAADLIELHPNEEDMSELLDGDFSTLINFDGDNLNSNAINHVKPKSLFGGYEDFVSDLFV